MTADFQSVAICCAIVFFLFLDERRKGLALVGGVTVWFYKAGHRSQLVESSKPN